MGALKLGITAKCMSQHLPSLSLSLSQIYTFFSSNETDKHKKELIKNIKNNIEKGLGYDLNCV
jgi:hypothetical protein